MISRIIYCCIALSLSATQLHGQGIEFFKGTWAELLEKSKSTGKPVFVDVYTTWCGPCKMMDKNVFPLKVVGDKFNAAFINYKVDAEKGEGVGIAGKYNVTGYPTYLFLRSDGELVHRSMGYGGDPAYFLMEADKAVEVAKDPYTISKMEKDYAAGKSDTAFLKMYAARLNRLGMNNNKPLDEYLGKLPAAEQTTNKTLQFLLANVKDANTAAFQLLVQHSRVLADTAAGGNAMATNQLAYTLQQSLSKALAKGKYELAGQLLEYVKNIPARDYEKEMFDFQRMEYFAATGKTDSLTAAAIQMVKEIEPMRVADIRNMDKQRLNEFMQPYLTGQLDSTKNDYYEKSKSYAATYHSGRMANRLYVAAKNIQEHVKDKMVLQRALTWTNKALGLHPNDHNTMMVHANLLYASGNRKEGIAAMEKVLVTARGNKANLPPIESRLAEMRKGK